MMKQYSAEHILNLISEAYPGLITYITKDYRYMFANAEYLQWFGKDPEDFRGKTVEEVVGKEVLDQRKPYIERALKGEHVKFITKMKHKKLGVRDIEQIYKPDFDENGHIKGLISLAYDITEQKKAENLAKENELRFRSLTEAIPQLVLVTDTEGNAIWFNENWQKATGTTFEENLGLGWINAIHPDDREAAYHNWLEGLHGDSRKATEYRLRMADGSYRWHISRSIPMKDEHGKLLRWVGTTTDIEEQKKAQNAAEKERERIYSLFMQAPIIFVVTQGPEHILELINPETMKYFPNRELQGKSMKEGMLEIYEQGFGKLFDEIYATGVGQTFKAVEVKIDRGVGPEKIYVDFFFEPIKDENGSTTGILTIAVDVAEQVFASRKIKESEELFRHYAESMPQMVYITDGEGNITYLNHQWKKYADIDSNDPDFWKKLIHKDDLPKASALWREAHKEGKSYEGEFRYLRKDGEYRWHLNRAVAIQDSQGNVIQWIGTVTDIHDRKMFESELKANEKKLEAALIARDQFVSVASHELKTPLTSLKLQSQLTLKSLAAGKEFSRERILSMAVQTNELVDRLTHLIDDMLDVSRINTGKLRFNKTRNEMGEIVRDVVSRMELLFESSGLKPPIVQTEEKLYGFWDRFRLEQVLSNLLTNAIRYGRGKEISVNVKRTEKDVLISVSDKGWGINKEDQKRIFERFERAIDSSEVSGLGLGLFIAKEIVEGHGGKIWVESELNQGSTFYVILPLEENEDKL